MARRPRGSPAAVHLPARHPLAWSALGTAAGLHAVPSALVLGQWWPSRLPGLTALPGGLARWRGPATGRRQVALTFDDGPDPESTPLVLDALGRRGLIGTFFCLGEQAAAHPGIVQEISRRGHQIAVHGYHHRNHLLSTAAAIRSDLEAAVSVLRGITGAPVRFFRPPYGQVSGGSLWAARRLGLDLVLWSAWGREWTDRDPASAAARIGRRLSPGAIVLLHDSDYRAPAGTGAITAAMVDLVASTLAARQLQAVTLTGLLEP